MTTIHPIHLSISNAYLVKGPVNMLIDTGSPGEGKKILNFLRKHGLQLSDIALILHTHGHS
ncbi:MAG: MBL fold metallo-hydrolase, partial [Bacteroidota bacterium]